MVRLYVTSPSQHKQYKEDGILSKDTQPLHQQDSKPRININQAQTVLLKQSVNMYTSSLLSIAILVIPNLVQAHTLIERATVNGPCTGSGGTPGVCIATGKCRADGGTYISDACPGTGPDIKCCTKAHCGNGGNCRFASSCSTTTLTGLCPGPANFKCCVPNGSGYPAPKIPAVGACKAHAVSGAQKVVAGNKGKVRQIYCTRDCACPGTSDHCCGLAIDFMCSSAGGVSRFCLSPCFPGSESLDDGAYACAMI